MVEGRGGGERRAYRGGSKNLHFISHAENYFDASQPLINENFAWKSYESCWLALAGLLARLSRRNERNSVCNARQKEIYSAVKEKLT